MADMSIGDFRKLIEAIRRLYDIMTEIGESTEIKDVTIEDGTTRPTWTKYLSQALAHIGFYQTVDLGLADVAEGGFFGVPGDIPEYDSSGDIVGSEAGDYYLTGYRKINGEAVKVDSLPGNKAIDSLKYLTDIIRNNQQGTYALEVRDSFENIAMALEWSGILHAVGMKAKESLGVTDLTITNGNDGRALLWVKDEKGRLGLALGASGTLYVHSIDVGGNLIRLEQNDTIKNAFVICQGGDLSKVLAYFNDQNVFNVHSINAKGNVSVSGDLIVNNQSITDIVDNLLENQNRERYQPQPFYGVVHYLSYGQSQSIGSIGGGAPASLKYVINGADSAYALMPKGGLRNGSPVSDDDARVADYFDPVPLHETVQGVWCETAASSYANKIQADYQEAIDANEFRLYATNSGFGSHSVAKLSPGTEEHERLLMAIDGVYNYAQSQGLPVSIPMMYWWQAHDDQKAGTAAPTYISRMQAIFDSIKQKIADRQDKPIDDISLPIFMVQPDNFLYFSYADINKAAAISKAYLEYAENHDDVILVPFYWCTNADGTVHCDPISYARMGVYHAIATRERIIKGDTEFKGVRPKRWWREGKVLTVEMYITYGGLQFWQGPETAPISEIANYGFNAYDADMNELEIASVNITGSNKVSIALKEDWKAGDFIGYAWSDNGDAGKARVGGNRGWLFDTNGERDKFTIADIEYEFHWPSCQFLKEIQ